MSRKDIDILVCGILDYYGTNAPKDILKQMGFKIIYVDKDNPLLLKNDSYTYLQKSIVYVRNDLNEYEEVFALRHEIGHLLMHVNKDSTRFLNYRRMEREADYFALKLTNARIDEIEMESMTLEQIASYINVPYNILFTLKEVIQ